LAKERARCVAPALLALLVLGAAGYGVYHYIPQEQVPPSVQPETRPPATAEGTDDHLIIMTWNIRGYPESKPEYTAWLHKQIVDLKADVLCVQEIANQAKVNAFVHDDERLKKVAFRDSGDGQDNAIFTTDAIGVEDIEDPQGFQHPAQAAYIWYKGFDAVLITVHLSWTDVSKRAQEKELLRQVVQSALQLDPDVIIVGDFNTTEQGIQELASSLGMVVMVPVGQDGVGTTQAGNRYDHFLVSPNLASEEAETSHIVTFAGADLDVAKKVSDHLPVVCRFKADAKFRDRKQP